MRWWGQKTPPWSYLNVTVPNISVTAQVANYDLPGNLQHIYSVRLATAQRTLSYVEPRLYDRTDGPYATPDTPGAYTLFSRGQTNEITLIPTPGAIDILQIKGVRQVVIPVKDDDLLDILEPDVGAIIHYAKGLVLADRSGAEGRRDFHIQRAELGRQDARVRDRHEEDDDLILLPSTATAPGYPPTHAQYYLRDTY